MDLVPTLADLVAYPTVSDQPVTDLAAYLAQRAEDAGLKVARFETSPGKCNLVARAGPPDTDGLLLCGHMDVVPVTGQPWTSDPFSLTRVGDRLVGRGACDMKAFLAAVTCALHDLPLRSVNHPLQRELVLAWTHDEEIGCHGSRALISQLAADASGLPSLALIGEPTDLQMCRAHPGHTTLRVSCRGRAAHSSRPSLGTNAITIAAEVIGVLSRLQTRWAQRTPTDWTPQLDPEVLAALPTPYPVLSCGQIAGGSAVNIVPDHCELWVGLRQLPGQQGTELFAELEQELAALSARWQQAGGSVSTDLQQEAPALLTPAGTQLEYLLAPHARSPRAGAAAFATDAGNLAQAGVNSIVFGPGSIDVAHKADEYVPIDQLHACRDVVADIVRRRCLGLS